MSLNKTKLAVLLTASAVTITLFFLTPTSQTNISQIKASRNEYTLIFSETENRLNPGFESSDVYTSLGNPISFEHSGYSHPDGMWGELSEYGYVYNTTPLSGLTSLSVVYANVNEYGNGNGDLIVSYGWLNDSKYINYEVDDGLISSTETEYDFDGNHPSYFKITASHEDLAYIESMTLTYYCEEIANPFPTSHLLCFSDEVDDDYGHGYYVSGCDETATSIVLPSVHNGLPVFGIADNAFRNYSSLTSITIPNSITYIGDSAFFGCSSLTSINIPDSTTYIGYTAFYGCNSLASITIPESVKTIGFWAFISMSSSFKIYYQVNPIPNEWPEGWDPDWNPMYYPVESSL